jgi:hypothetical protein
MCVGWLRLSLRLGQEAFRYLRMHHLRMEEKQLDDQHGQHC